MIGVIKIVKAALTEPPQVRERGRQPHMTAPRPTPRLRACTACKAFLLRQLLKLEGLAHKHVCHLYYCV
jgi:hypothetical protein